MVTEDGRDLTALYEKGVAETLARLGGASVTLAILKARSPTCGSGEIYDGTFSHRRVPGNGLLARALKEQGIPVRTEEDIARLMEG